jgi:hypothetical protein
LCSYFDSFFEIGEYGKLHGDSFFEKRAAYLVGKCGHVKTE